MYRAYFYLPDEKGARYSIPSESPGEAIERAKNEIGNGEAGLYCLIYQRSMGPDQLIWDSHNPDPLTEQEQAVIALQEAWEKAFGACEKMPLSERKQIVMHHLNTIADEIDGILARLPEKE